MAATSEDKRITKAPRLFIEGDLAKGAKLACEAGQANYLINVLRLRERAFVRAFNGRDGEWLTEIIAARRSKCTLHAREQLRAQETPPDLEYLFAPLKKARLDYMVQKATEMGVAALQPVMTSYTAAERINLQRMYANAIEAAEQCNILWVPETAPPRTLREIMAGWPSNRRLIFCDEAAPVTSPIDALSGLARGPLAVLVGPEGGFSEAERASLHDAAFAVPISLGPRVMRADTAAVAALALVNAVLGDWQ